MRKRDERMAAADVWETVANAVGGTVVPVQDAWGNRNSVEVAVDANIKILLDVHTTMILIGGKIPAPIQFARAVATFPVRGEGLRLLVTRANPFSGLGKLFGMQDIEVGDRAFDDAFVIKGGDEEQVTRLLSGEPGEALRGILLARQDVCFGISDDGREASATTELASTHDVVHGMLSRVDADSFIMLHKLMSETLQGLKRIGVAQATDR